MFRNLRKAITELKHGWEDPENMFRTPNTSRRGSCTAYSDAHSDLPVARLSDFTGEREQERLQSHVDLPVAHDSPPVPALFTGEALQVVEGAEDMASPRSPCRKKHKTEETQETQNGRLRDVEGFYGYQQDKLHPWYGHYLVKFFGEDKKVWCLRRELKGVNPKWFNEAKVMGCELPLL